jgi:isopentenyl diphosphate isomerase/L-lactate dehydrogenase-like FMN-dependent dehydrogenase
VLVDGPAGPREVDARPSDAVNLALTADAPIRVGSELFGPALAEGMPFRATEATVATAELADEARRLFFAAQLAERRAEDPAERPDSGPAGE